MLYSQCSESGDSGKIEGMFRYLVICLVVFSVSAAAQSKKQPPLPPSQTPPRSTPAVDPRPDSTSITPTGDSSSSSSSKDDAIDLAPPAGDDKAHPASAEAVRDAEDEAGLYEGDEIGGVQEFKPWDPHKAEKDVEVGDFYFKRKNYRAAVDRYREALYYKNDDAVATFKLAICQEKLGEVEDARQGYENYLKILPEGPFAEEAHRGIERLKTQTPPSPFSKSTEAK
jgi:tetratricopeptide (TPR) repeat protein